MDIKRPKPKQHIPLDAKLVFKGKLYNFYQWQQKMYDGSKQIFEGLTRTDTVNIIPLTPDGKIILLEQEQPGLKSFVSVAGGRIDQGETPLQAAKRELLEETGYQSSDYIFWDAVQLETKIDWACFTFIAKNCQKIKDTKKDPGEKIKLKFVSFDEFVQISTQDNFRDSEIVIKLYKILYNSKELENFKKILS